MTFNIEDYSQTPLTGDEGMGEGVYRGFPLAWTLEESTKEDSKSVALAIRFAIMAKWGGAEDGWSDTWPPGYFTEARVWIIRKDGTLNDGAVANLGKCGLWNGDPDVIEQGPPPHSTVVLLTVEGDTYEGKTRYRADWINPNADTPPARGSFKPVNPNLVAMIGKMHGSRMKAVAGGQPQGAAPAPPTPPQPPQVQPAQPQPPVAAQPATAPPVQPQAAVPPQQVPPTAPPQPGMPPTAATPPVPPASVPPAMPPQNPTQAAAQATLDEEDAPF